MSTLSDWRSAVTGAAGPERLRISPPVPRAANRAINAFAARISLVRLKGTSSLMRAKWSGEAPAQGIRGRAPNSKPIGTRMPPVPLAAAMRNARTEICRALSARVRAAARSS
jgi:hypothetical protein